MSYSKVIIFTFYIIFALVAIWAGIQAWQSQAKTETIHPYKAFLHLFVFYQTYLFFPMAVFSIAGIYLGRFSWAQGISLLIISVLIIYARFIEPNWIQVKYTSYSWDKPLQHPVKIALIADVHVGLFSGHESQLKRVVEKINQEQPDLVVVAGDWTYEPENTLADELYMLKEIKAPVYSVNGNHDEEVPGPPIQQLLADALHQNNVMDIEKKVIEFDEFRLIGVGDMWAGKSDMEMMGKLPQDKPWIILSHNPDTVEMVPKLPTHPLMLSGHTHGGQVYIPWLTAYVLKQISIVGHNKGLYQHKNADVYVTVGTGMVGVPFRFLIRPTVDIIELK